MPVPPLFYPDPVTPRLVDLSRVGGYLKLIVDTEIRYINVEDSDIHLERNVAGDLDMVVSGTIRVPIDDISLISFNQEICADQADFDARLALIFPDHYGSTGIKGDTGATGAAGAPGAPGAAGAAGAVGPRGLQGLQGLHGTTGAPGPAGPSAALLPLALVVIEVPITALLAGDYRVSVPRLANYDIHFLERRGAGTLRKTEYLITAEGFELTNHSDLIAEGEVFFAKGYFRPVFEVAITAAMAGTTLVVVPELSGLAIDSVERFSRGSLMASEWTLHPGGGFNIADSADVVLEGELFFLRGKFNTTQTGLPVDILIDAPLVGGYLVPVPAPALVGRVFTELERRGFGLLMRSEYNILPGGEFDLSTSLDPLRLDEAFFARG